MACFTAPATKEADPDAARRHRERDRELATLRLERLTSRLLREHEANCRRRDAALKVKMRKLSNQAAAATVRAAGRLAKKLQRLREERDATITAIDAATASSSPPTPQQAEETFFAEPRRQTRNVTAMGERPPGFEGPPLVQVIFDYRYGCIERINGVDAHDCREFWFANGTHVDNVLHSSIYVKRVSAVPPTLPDKYVYIDTEGAEQLEPAGVLQRGDAVWVHFNQQLDDSFDDRVVIWRSGFYYGVVQGLVWEHIASE